MSGTRAPHRADEQYPRDPDHVSVRRKGWVVTLMLLAFMLINFADKAVVGLAGVEIKRDLGLTDEQFGLVQSGFFWLFAAGALIVGALHGRIRARWLLAGIVLVWCISLAPLTTTVGFGVLLACRVVLGFAEGPAPALATAIAHSWFVPKRRALPGTVVVTGASLGPLLAAPLLTWVIQRYDWHAAFTVLIAAGVLWAALWLAVGREGPAGAAAAVEPPPDSAAGEAAPLLRVLVCPTVIGVALLTFSSYLGTALKISWLPVFLREGLGYAPDTTALLVTLPYGIAVAAALVAGTLSERFSRGGASSRAARTLPAALCVVLCGTCMVGFTLVPPGGVQMALIVGAFSLNTAAWGIALAGLSDAVPHARRTTVMSVIVAVYSMGGVVAPAVLGWFVGGAGYNAGFALLGVVMVAGAVVAALLMHPERDAAALATAVRAHAAGDTSP